MLLFFVVFGLLLGYAKGGSLSHIDKNVPEALHLPVLAFLAELLAIQTDVLPEWFQLNLVYFLLFWFILRNRKAGAWPLFFGLGTLMNYGVIAANGYRMPVVPVAGSAPFAAGEIFGYVLADESTRLLFLGDVIAVPVLGEFVGLASIGDLVLGLGVGLLAYRLTRPKQLDKL